MTINNQINPFFSKSSSNNTLEIHGLVEQLYHHWRFIALVTAVSFITAFLYTFTLHPQYQTTALIQTKSNSDTNILDTVGYRSKLKSQSETELALIKTPFILEPVIIENALNVKVKPYHFPVLGAWMAKHVYKSPDLIQIDQFVAPSYYAGKIFKLVLVSPTHYQLYAEDGEFILSGELSKKAVSKLEPGFKLLVSNADARSGTAFEISYQSPYKMAKELAKMLEIQPIEGGETEISQLVLTGSSPTQIVQVLNAIVHYAVQNSVQENSKETQKTLEFLHKRLPELKMSLDQSEQAISEYSIQSGNLGGVNQGQLLMQQLINLEADRENIRSQRKHLLQVYTPKYPPVIANKIEEKDLSKKIDQLKLKMQVSPMADQKGVELLRDADIKNTLYGSLLAKVQQLEIAKAGSLGDIIALGTAAPSEQLSSKRNKILLLGFFSGFLFSIIFILLKYALFATIESVDMLEQDLGIPVRGVIYFSKTQNKMNLLQSRAVSTDPLILSKLAPADLSIESMRGLLVGLSSIPVENSQVVTIMSAHSNVGKSFIALNMAQLMADSGKRTLLIDADLRRGGFSWLPNQLKFGLSEYLEKKADAGEIIHSVDPYLSVVSSGHYAQHPVGLLESQRFQEFMVLARQQYDHIIIDTAPVLSVIDGILAARKSDINLFIADKSSERVTNIRRAIKVISSHGLRVHGIVLNHKKPHLVGNAYYSSYY